MDEHRAISASDESFASTLFDAVTGGDSGQQAHPISTAVRRGRALEDLSTELRRRGHTGRVIEPSEAHKLPTLVTCNTDTFAPRGYIEVRRGLGQVDWYCWQDSDEIVPADSPEVAAALIIEALE